MTLIKEIEVFSIRLRFSIIFIEKIWELCVMFGREGAVHPLQEALTVTILALGEMWVDEELPQLFKAEKLLIRDFKQAQNTYKKYAHCPEKAAKTFRKIMKKYHNIQNMPHKLKNKICAIEVILEDIVPNGFAKKLSTQRLKYKKDPILAIQRMSEIKDMVDLGIMPRYMRMEMRMIGGVLGELFGDNMPPDDKNTGESNTEA